MPLGIITTAAVRHTIITAIGCTVFSSLAAPITLRITIHVLHLHVYKRRFEF